MIDHDQGRLITQKNECPRHLRPRHREPATDRPNGSDLWRRNGKGMDERTLLGSTWFIMAQGLAVQRVAVVRSRGAYVCPPRVVLVGVLTRLDDPPSSLAEQNEGELILMSVARASMEGGLCEDVDRLAWTVQAAAP